MAGDWKKEREAISPFSFIDKEETQNDHDKNVNQLEENFSKQYYGYNCQNDMQSAYFGRLYYEMAKMKMNLDKNEVCMQQKLEYEHKLNELKIHYHTYMQMMSCVVYKDSQENLIFAITNPESNAIVAKQLLNVKNFKTYICVTYYPQIKMVLEVTWGDGQANRIVLPYNKEGIATNYFIKRLKAKGVLFLVSGRTEKSAANALLAYIFENAEVVELPTFHGWVKTGDGKWHYVSKSERTFMEVINNV